MDISEIIIAGDTSGIEWRLPVYRFKGRNAAAPKTYIQAALHANELPGTALAHFLLEKLQQAEKDGAILGDITVVPQANPIGTAQSHFGELQGRFDLGSRTNFNRDFPLISLADRDYLIEDLDRYSATDRLKRQLLHMALGADLMLDLHCDDEALQYAYIDDAFWPEAGDLASALDMEAVFLSDGESSAFEEAVAYMPGNMRPGRRRRVCRDVSRSPSSFAARATFIRSLPVRTQRVSSASSSPVASLPVTKRRSRRSPASSPPSTTSR